MIRTKKGARRKSLRPTGPADLIREVQGEIRECTVCPDMAPHRKRPSGSVGTTQTGYVLVGPSPRAMPILEQSLREVGDDRYRHLEDLFYLADAVRCLPPARLDPNRFRAPTQTECKACGFFLYFELRVLRPRRIVAVGSQAARAVLGRPVKLADEHAKLQTVGESQAICLLDPAPQNRAALKKQKLTLGRYKVWLKGFLGSLIDDL